MTDWGRLAADRLDEIAQISEAGPGVTRLPFTCEHRAAIALLQEWMEEAGLRARLDDAGTLVGRHEGRRGSGTFYLGSHQDSVREGGAYDGIMGVVLPVLAMRRLKEAEALPPVSVEILAFADEEGVRWPTALIGPRAIAGTFDPAVLAMEDKDGVTLRAAIEAFGLDPERIADTRRQNEDAIGFLETHIEQGPVLEECGAPLGIVTAICGIERHQIALVGEAGHAGTLPMASRRDALVGAAALVTETHRLASATKDLRATVGELHVSPNGVNAVPREVRMTVELRSPSDGIRSDAGLHIHACAEKVASDIGLQIRAERTYAQPAQPCDARLASLLAQAVSNLGEDPIRLPSGATHDASAMADLCPIAMLFVRCRGGVSHSPQEFASPQDLGYAIDALAGLLQQIARI
ncbi:N-carbamoyl-L-amino acid hydrolase [Defluviimonas aquaemixtae]|uniref:N-carbamoyl-L-amino acid hydrolase n=1 Tax=Albidovulum aquaemixtae TaxID=1542388 RepID=A0A2R8B3A5_9RHOB|nr:M20 family metallo-hydrolase [Defluviimonas aquaemixtae]SPH16953.1 N-carbamoyl-L-amino acid hydrolase [Defluviimonas aquaemixtae]